MSSAKLIDQYCKTLDAQYLLEINPDDRQDLIDTAVVGMKKGERKHVAKKLLYVYGLDERGKPLPEPKLAKRVHAENTLAGFSIGLTGARPGDVLVGKSNVNNGSIIKIHDQAVYPTRKAVDRILGYPDLWKKYMIRLGSIDFFADMTIKEREQWILTNRDPSEVSIGESGELVEILQPTGDFLNRLTPEQIQVLTNGNPSSKDGYWTSQEIEAMFPHKPGSKARKATLIMYRGMWRLSVDYNVVTNYTGPTIDVYAGDFVTPNDGNIVYVIDDITKKYVKKKDKWVRPPGKANVQKIGFRVDKNNTPINTAMINDAIKSFGDWGNDEIAVVRNGLRNFTGATYKSLLQKIIRFRPLHVTIDKVEYDPNLVLLVTVGELLMYPGALVPDINRYVTGLESAAKRVAVSILEDSSVEQPEYLASLLSGAFVAQRAKGWYPTIKLIKQWFGYAIEGAESDKMYKYTTKNFTTPPYVINSKNTVIENCSGLLDELRSFHSDLRMTRDIAANYATIEYLPPGDTETPQPLTMPIEHCVDHHWFPNIVYFYQPTTAKKIMAKSPTGYPYKRLLDKIFWEVTGINPRRSWELDIDTFEDQPFFAETRKIQKLILQAKQNPQKIRPIVGKGKIVKTTTLDIGWLSAMVGAIEIKGNPIVLVTMRSDDPLQLIVARRPSRDMKDSTITPKRYEEAIIAAKKILAKGVLLDKTAPPSPVFKKARVFLRDDQYYIKTADGEELDWDTAAKIVNKYPKHPKLKPTLENALMNRGDGIQVDAKKDFEKLLAETPAAVLRRAIMYLSTFNDKFEMNRVSRSGAGVYQAVVFEDIGALQFILKLSILYPAAIRPVEYQPTKFTVPVRPLLWNIADRIKKILVGKISENVSQEWSEFAIGDSKKRKAWEHQQEALAEMKEQHNAGRKGHFIAIPVGLGKTFIVASYLQWLISQSQLPKHIVYTLPRTAIKSVAAEIQAFGFEVELLLPIKGIKDYSVPVGVKVSQNCELQPFTVTLIEHDHLRLCATELVRSAPDCVIVIDEVHKALNDSQRTSVALQMSHLSREFIAMTGTPVIDSNTHKLLWWLSQVVPFEVNDKNFWVAANSMIAKKVNTGVIVDRKEILALFNKREQKIYSESVPPLLGGTNTSPSSADWNAALTVSYAACNRRMIKQINSLLKIGRGVMVVAKDIKHQQELYDMVLKGTKLTAKQIYSLKAKDSILLTDDEVKAGKVPDYRVVIVPIHKAEGYTLTRLSAMVSSVYPSNNATREQIEGRINRIGQKKKKVLYRIIHAGLLTRILEKHASATSLSLALQSLADEAEL